LADQSRTIRLPVHLVDVVTRLGRLHRELFQALGREPTVEELARNMDITVARVLEIRHFTQEPLSLDQAIGEEGDSLLGEFVADTQALDAAEAVAYALLQDQLASVLDTLSPREASIIRLRFGLTGGRMHTLEEIARLHRVTRERIRQIENKTMAKLRHPPRSRPLRDYLN